MICDRVTWCSLTARCSLTVGEQAISPEEALERLAVSFLTDTFRGRDVRLHMVLLLKGGRFKVQLIRAFRLTHSPLYLLLVNLLIVTLICLTITEVCLFCTCVSVCLLCAFLAVCVPLFAYLLLCFSRCASSFAFLGVPLSRSLHIPWCLFLLSCCLRSIYACPPASLSLCDSLPLLCL